MDSAPPSSGLLDPRTPSPALHAVVAAAASRAGLIAMASPVPGAAPGSLTAFNAPQPPPHLQHAADGAQQPQAAGAAAGDAQGPRRLSAWGSSRDAVFLPDGWVPPDDLLRELMDDDGGGAVLMHGGALPTPGAGVGAASPHWGAAQQQQQQQQQQGAPARVQMEPRAPRAMVGRSVSQPQHAGPYLAAVAAAPPGPVAGPAAAAALHEGQLMLAVEGAGAPAQQRRRHSVAAYGPPDAGAAAYGAAGFAAGAAGVGGAPPLMEDLRSYVPGVAQRSSMSVMSAVPPLPMGTGEALPGRRGSGTSHARLSRRRSAE